jgi:hypothetical protein
MLDHARIDRITGVEVGFNGVAKAIVDEGCAEQLREGLRGSTRQITAY